ncbi:MAG: 2-oxo acid dehydrogenase subunit E2 [Alphaproteobacteria bacterium]|nr:2-oxo acid dehydrogenase subunit E2 [Alphaproteobacteria bacterium]
MPHLQLQPKQNLSSFRRIAIGTWKTAYDPSVYGCLKLPADPVLAYIDAFRERTGRRLTLTHMLVRATAAVLEEMPDANAILRFNRIYLRKDIGIFFQVAMEDEQSGEIDLSGVTIHGANAKTVLEILDETEARVAQVRAHKDKELEQTRSTFKKIPFFLLNRVLNTIGLLTYTLNLDLRWAGIPRDPFGSVMITNVGSLGLEEAYVPLVPYSRVPLLIAVGAVKEEPVVVDGAITVGRTVSLFATFDHRILDGSHAAHMSRTIRAWFADPERYFGPLPDPA